MVLPFLIPKILCTIKIGNNSKLLLDSIIIFKYNNDILKIEDTSKVCIKK